MKLPISLKIHIPDKGPRLININLWPIYLYKISTLIPRSVINQGDDYEIHDTTVGLSADCCVFVL